MDSILLTVIVGQPPCSGMRQRNIDLKNRDLMLFTASMYYSYMPYVFKYLLFLSNINDY